MNKKTIAVTGATGNIGKVIVERLKAQGHEVREVARKKGIDVDHPDQLTRAFTGADALFLMIPPNYAASNPRQDQNRVGKNLADAAKASGARRIVFLSSIEGHLSAGTGPILGLHDMEERLKHTTFPELVLLRPTYFMENHLHGLGLIRQAGIYGTPLQPDRPIPMIATRDIGEKAAELLVSGDGSGGVVRELLGPREYTMTEVTRILGGSIGKPDLKYVQFPYDEARKAMIGMGISEAVAELFNEMNRHFNEVKTIGTEKRSPQNTTPTPLEIFAKEIFQPAFNTATPVTAQQ